MSETETLPRYSDQETVSRQDTCLETLSLLTTDRMDAVLQCQFPLATTTTTSVWRPFSRRTWVNRRQKGKPFWFLLEQEMMGWQWHQCTSLQTDNHACTSPLSFLQGGCPSYCPTNSVRALKAMLADSDKCDRCDVAMSKSACRIYWW